MRALRESGVTIILTTHYIEEAEEMADRIGVISKGEMILVEEKAALMRKLGKKRLTCNLPGPLAQIPRRCAAMASTLSEDGSELVYSYDAAARAYRHHRAASGPGATRASSFKDLEPSRVRSKIFSSAW